MRTDIFVQSRRLRECIELMAEGCTMAEAGLKLGIARRTVLMHLTRAKMLTGAKNTTHLIAICYRIGVLPTKAGKETGTDR